MDTASCIMCGHAQPSETLKASTHLAGERLGPPQRYHLRAFSARPGVKREAPRANTQSCVFPFLVLFSDVLSDTFMRTHTCWAGDKTTRRIPPCVKTATPGAEVLSPTQ